MTVTVRLPWPGGAVAGHANGRHWAPRARATRLLRRAGKWAGIEAGLHLRPMPSAHLHVTYHPPKGRGGLPDVQNMPGRCKALIDGIADAMGCDDRGFRVHFPAEFSERVEGGAVVVKVTTGDDWQHIGDVARGMVKGRVG